MVKCLALGSNVVITVSTDNEICTLREESIVVVPSHYLLIDLSVCYVACGLDILD